MSVSLPASRPTTQGAGLGGAVVPSSPQAPRPATSGQNAGAKKGTRPEMDFKIPGVSEDGAIWRRGTSLFTSQALESRTAAKEQQTSRPNCWSDRYSSPYKTPTPRGDFSSSSKSSLSKLKFRTSAAGSATAREFELGNSLKSPRQLRGLALPSFSNSLPTPGQGKTSRQETLRSLILVEAEVICEREFLWEKDEVFSFVTSLKDRTKDLRNKSLMLIKTFDEDAQLAREAAEAEAEALRFAREKAEAEASRLQLLDKEREEAERQAQVADSQHVEEELTVCVCGNVFMCDAQFCRKCGERRPGADEESEGQADSSQDELHSGGKRQSHSEKLKNMRREMRKRIMDRVPDHLNKAGGRATVGEQPSSASELEMAKGAAGGGRSQSLSQYSNGMGRPSIARKSLKKKPFVPFAMGGDKASSSREARDSAVVAQVVCPCGNVFAEDAQFCRKCGSKRPPVDEEGLALIEEAKALESNANDTGRSGKAKSIGGSASQPVGSMRSSSMLQRKNKTISFPPAKSQSTKTKNPNLTIVLEDRRKISSPAKKGGGGGTVSISVDLVIYEDRSTNAVVIKACELSWPKRQTSRTIEKKMLTDIYVYGDVMDDLPEGRYEYLASLVDFEKDEHDAVVIALQGYDEAVNSGARRLDEEDVLKGSFRNMFQERKMEFQHHDRLCGVSKSAENFGEKAKEIKAVADKEQIYVPVVESIHEWFEKMDVSGDGSIDKDEFGEFCKWLTNTAKSFNSPCQEISEAQFNRIWVEFNRQGGGEIKFPRFVEWLVGKWPHIRTMSVRDVAKFTGRS